MISRLVTKAVVIGVAATVAIAAPASAAATPTLTGPEEVVGFAEFTMTGTADPGTTVDLWETAIGFDSPERARDWTTADGYVSATADASGKFTIKRFLDSGFYFEVRQGAVKSARYTVYSRIKPTFWVGRDATTPVGELDPGISVSPNQPGLDVHIQRQSGSSWVAVKTIKSGEDSVTTTITGQPAGTQHYRAVVDGDSSNGVRGATSATVETWVRGTTGPTTPPPTGPAVGSVIFGKIQYDAPGTDSGSNGSLNTEWARLTNTTKSAINLKGWTVRDQQNIVYTFPSYSLGAGASMILRSGKGTNVAATRYWGRAGKVGYVWNNAGETAYLKNPAGTNIDTCKWTTVSPGYTNC